MSAAVQPPAKEQESAEMMLDDGWTVTWTERLKVAVLSFEE